MNNDQLRAKVARLGPYDDYPACSVCGEPCDHLDDEHGWFCHEHKPRSKAAQEAYDDLQAELQRDRQCES